VSIIKRAIVKSYDAPAHKATVQIAGSLAVWLDDVRVATNIPPADVVSGRQCTVLFLDPSNQDDALVLTIQGAAPSGGGGSSTFVGLTDTPGSYSGQAAKHVRVASAENALEFFDHDGAADPHTQYQKESEKDADTGYVGRDANGKLDVKGVVIEDTDGTPVGDVLLKVIDETLQLRNEADDDYASLEADTFSFKLIQALANAVNIKTAQVPAGAIQMQSYNGSSWVVNIKTQGGIMSLRGALLVDDIDAGSSYTVKNLKAPVNDNDAARKVDLPAGGGDNHAPIGAYFPGVLSTGIKKTPQVPYKGDGFTMATLYCRVAVAPSGAAITVQLRRNGNNLGSAATIAISANTGSVAISQAIADGDYFDIDITQTGTSPNEGSDLVWLVVP
jgi:hypothetical protein